MKRGSLLLIALTLVILMMGNVSAGDFDDFNADGTDNILCSADDVALDLSKDSDVFLGSVDDDVLGSADNDMNEDNVVISAVNDMNEDNVEIADALGDEGDDPITPDDTNPKTHIDINSYHHWDERPHSVNIYDDTDYVAKIYTDTQAEGSVTVSIGKQYNVLREIAFIDNIQSLYHETDDNDTGYSTYYIRPSDLDDLSPDWYYVEVVYLFGLSLNETAEDIVRFVEDSRHVWIDAPSEILIGDWDQSYMTVFVEGNLGYLRVLIDNEEVFEDLVGNLVYDEEDGYNYYIPIYLGDLSTGSHSYKISYYGGNWDNVSFEGTIDVSYLFKLMYDDEVDFGDDVDFMIILPYDAVGNQINVNGQVYEINLTDGIASLTLSDFELGKNLLSFTFNDAFYGEKTIVSSLNVNPKLIVPSEICVVNGDNLILKLPNDAQGSLNIYIYDGDSNILNDSVELVDGEANYSFDSWAFGSYHILVEYDDGKYRLSNESDIFIVPYVDLSNETVMSEGAKLNIEIPRVSGTIFVNLNGEEIRFEDIADGKISLTIPADCLHLGENIVTLEYVGEDLDGNPFSYIIDGQTVPIEYKVVVKPNELLIPDEFSSDESGNITVELPEGSSGYLTVYVNGEEVSTSSVSAGTNIVPLSGLEVGDNEVKVVLTDENGYNYTSVKNVTVSKPVPSSDITVPTDSSIPKFSIDLPSDATGRLIVSINGKEYVKDLVNGKASISIPGLADGTYNVTIKYTGDQKYGGFNKKTTVTIKTAKPVALKDPNLTIKVPSIYKGKKAVITITTDKAFSGKVTVKIKSKTYVVNVVKGKGSLSISGLAVGTYKATVTFAANNVFKSSTKSISFKVKANVIKLTLKKVKVKRSLKKLIIKATLRINGKLAKAKKLTFKFNKKTYKAKTNKKGIAKITIKKKVLKKLKVGKKIRYQVSYGKKTVKRTVKVRR